MTQLSKGQEERIKEAVIKRISSYSVETSDNMFRLTLSAEDAREHIIRIGVSILCTKWGIGFPGGSFVQAIVDNNLMETYGRADSINVNCIRFYVSLIYNQGYIE